jgi:uncharacterized membrane protein
MEKLLKEKKGILGLNTVKAFIVVLLALAIVAVVFIIVLGFFSTDSFLSGTAPKSSEIDVTNETVTTPTETGVDLANAGRLSVSCTVGVCINVTGEDAIPADNITATGCNVAFAGAEDTDGYNNSNWQCTYSYNYRQSELITGITDNTTDGVVSFFGNTTTFFSLLVVVVIILIVSLVIVVVNRFGGETGASTQEIGTNQSIAGSGPSASL